MADFVTDAFEAGKAGLFFWKDGKAVKYLLAQIVFSIVALGLLAITGIIAFIAFLLPFVESFKAYSPESAPIIDMLRPLSGMAIPASLAFIVLLILSVLISAMLNALIYSRGLTNAGMKTLPVTWSLAGKLIVAAVATLVLVVLPIHKQKSLIIQLACYAIAIISILALGIIGGAIAEIAFGVAFVVMMYNAIQMGFVQEIILTQGKGVFDSVRESVRIIAGRTIRYLAVSFIAGIIVYVVFAIIQLVLGLIIDLTLSNSTQYVSYASYSTGVIVPNMLPELRETLSTVGIVKMIINMLVNAVMGVAMIFTAAVIFRQYFDFRLQQEQTPAK